MNLKTDEIRKAVREALAEDGAYDDVTSLSLGVPEKPMFAQIIARGEGVICGGEIVGEVFRSLYPESVTEILRKDSAKVRDGETVITVRAPAPALLAGERTALNFLSHLSGIASLTFRYAEEAEKANPDSRIYDTRKTLPGLRRFEKYAVVCGGGINHRFNLSDQILIKENHLKAAGLSVAEAVEKARKNAPGILIEIETETMEEFREALDSGAEIIMLDEFSPEMIKEACAIAKKASSNAAIEVSGGVTLGSVAGIASAGPERISAGRITNSAPVLDFSLLAEEAV